MRKEAVGNDLLTEGQRRHLVTTLARLEDHLHEIVALAKGSKPPAHRLLLQVVNDLPEGFGEACRGNITAAAVTLAELVAAFNLAPPTASRRQTVQALVTHGLVMVEDTVSRRLGGYGQIHRDLPPLLDPLLERLREHFLGIAGILPEPLPWGNQQEVP